MKNDNTYQLIKSLIVNIKIDKIKNKLENTFISILSI